MTSLERSQKRKKKRQGNALLTPSRDGGDARFDLARTTLGELQCAHDAPPPIRVGTLRKADPLDPLCRPGHVLTFPVLAKPRSVWFTDKTGDEVNGFSYGAITYERIYTEEEERAMAAAAAKLKQARLDKMEAALKASLKTAAKDAADAAERKRHLRANAASLLLERGWVGQAGGGYQHPSTLLLPAPARALQGPLPLPPTAHAAHRFAASLEAALPAPLGRALERLPSPVRESKRASLAAIHAADRALIADARDRANSAAYAAKKALVLGDDEGLSTLGSIGSVTSVVTANTTSAFSSANSSQRRARLPPSIAALAPAAAAPLTSLLSLPSPLSPDPVALAAHKRHNPVPAARHTSLDIRALPLGSYRKLRVSPHDLAVLEVIRAARADQASKTASASASAHDAAAAAYQSAAGVGGGAGGGGGSGSSSSLLLLSEKERALFDSVYARHIVAVQELQERQRYVGEEEKRQRRAARVRKKDEWRTL